MYPAKIGHRVANCSCYLPQGCRSPHTPRAYFRSSTTPRMKKSAKCRARCVWKDSVVSCPKTCRLVLALFSTRTNYSTSPALASVPWGSRGCAETRILTAMVNSLYATDLHVLEGLRVLRQRDGLAQTVAEHVVNPHQHVQLLQAEGQQRRRRRRRRRHACQGSDECSSLLLPL